MSLYTAYAASRRSTNNWGANGGTEQQVLADASDSTFAYRTGSQSLLQMQMATTGSGVPSTEFITGIRVGARLWTFTGGRISVALRQYTGTGNRAVGAISQTGASGNWITSRGPFVSGPLRAWSTCTNGVGADYGWNAANALVIDFSDTSTGSYSYIAQAFIEIRTVSTPAAPTVTIAATVTDSLAPQVAIVANDFRKITLASYSSAGTVRTFTTATAHGLVVGQSISVSGMGTTYDGAYTVATAPTSTTFTYAGSTSVTASGTGDPGLVSIGDGAVASAYQVRLFTPAQYGITNFNPLTSPATYDSGAVNINAREVTTQLPQLTNGATYRAYVRTAKAAGAATIWSAWSSSNFTVSVSTSTPVLSAVWVDLTQRTAINIKGKSNLLPSTAAETFTPSLGGWTVLAACTLAQNTTTYLGSVGSLAITATTAATTATAASAYVSIPAGGSADGMTVSAQVRSVTGTARQVRVELWLFDSSGTQINFVQGTAVTATSTGWTLASVFANTNSPVGIVSAQARVSVLNPAIGDVHVVDQICMVAGTSTTYVSGVPANTGATSWESAWTAQIVRTESGNVTTFSVPLNSIGEGVFSDYEVPRNTSPSYAVTVLGTRVDGAEQGSAVTSTVSANVTTTSDSQWWLKAVATPTLNFGGVRVLADPSEKVEEGVGVFRPLGRSLPLVTSGTIGGSDIELEIYTSTAADWEKLVALLRYQGTLLLQEPFTDSAGRTLQRYLRITDRSWERAGFVGQPRRTIKVSAVEVDRPTS